MLFTIELIIRSTLILVVCLLLMLALRKASASLKHWMISLTFLSLLALPIAHFILPKWGVELKNIETIDRIVPLENIILNNEKNFSQNKEDKSTIFSETKTLSPTLSSQPATISLEQAEVSHVITPTKQTYKETTTDRALSIDWGIAILMIWLMGFIYFSARMIGGLFKIRSITLNATNADISIEYLNEISPSNLPRILYSHAISTPMTWGFLRPVILLPNEAKFWTTSEMRTVIFHEYAHIKRGDYLLHLISLCVRNLYWFHPLVWLFNAIQLIEREKACDEYVLNMGLKPTDYAAQLISFVKRRTSAPSMKHLPALALARSSQIKRRTLAILSYKKIHPTSLKMQRWVAAIVLSALFLCAANMKPETKSSEVVKSNIFSSIQQISKDYAAPLSSSAIEIPLKLPITISDQITKSVTSDHHAIEENNNLSVNRIDQAPFILTSNVSSSISLPSALPSIQAQSQNPSTVSVPKGRLKKLLKKSFAFIENGQAYVDSNMVEVESFYIFKQEIANIDWQEFLADLKKQNDTETLAIAQIDSAMWSTLRYFKGAYHVVVKGEPKPEEGEKRFAKHFLDPITKTYHNHPAFWNYPIVNVNYQAAQLYCEWLTQKYKEIYGPDFPEGAYFRLPSKKEWVRAARGNSKSHYPWRGYHLKNKKGKYLANFKSMISAESIHYNQEDQEYEVINATTNVQDGYMITSPVKSYPQNDLGMYNMIGNVAEMLNQEGLAIGGSWNSTGFDVRVESIFQYEGASPMVGLRPVLVWPN